MTPVEKWTKALRDGGYGQATGSLKEGLGFCALGVLFHETGYLSRKGRLLARKSADHAVSNRLEAVTVLQRLGVPLHLADMVSDMNEAKASFAEIADFIEAYMKEQACT